QGPRRGPDQPGGRRQTLPGPPLGAGPARRRPLDPPRARPLGGTLPGVCAATVRAVTLDHSQRPESLPAEPTRPLVCQLLHGLEVGGAEVLAARLARRLRDAYRFLFV